MISSDPNTLNFVNVIIQNANNASYNTASVNGTYSAVTITYIPKVGEYPTFQ